MTGVYLYCLATDLEGGLPVLPGVEPDAAPVAVDCGEVAAVVSRVPLAGYSEEALPANLSDADWLAARARRHHQVVAALAGRATVAPLRFGTIFHSLGRLRAFLKERQGDVLAVLQQLRQREEWDVKVLLDCHEAEDEGQPAAGTASGRAYLLGRQAAYQRRLCRRRAMQRALAAVQEALEDRAAGATYPAPAVHVHPGLVLHGAFLVDRPERQAFLAAVESLVPVAAAAGLAVQLSGPWPAYHFSAIGM